MTITETATEYLRPSTINKLNEILNKNKKNAFIYAGGTDLLVKVRHDKISPSLYIDIKGIKSLSQIIIKKDHVSIGAAVTLNEIAENPFFVENFKALAYAASKVGSYQLRNRATIGGNICNASPAADTVPPLLIYNAKLKIVSQDNENIIEIHDFFKGPGKTILKHDEFLKEIILPLPGEKRSDFIKFSRRKAVDLSTVSIAVGIFNNNPKKPEVRIAVGACAPITMRAWNVEKYLNEKGLKDIEIENASKILCNEYINPISDLRGSKEFRYELTKSLFIKILNYIKESQ